MLKHLLVAGAASCALASAAAAQIAGPPQTYKGPSGTTVPAQVTQVVGLDSVTGASCLIGQSATCQLPGTSGGGAGGGAVTGAVGAFADGSNVTLGSKADNADTNSADTMTAMAAWKGIMASIQAAANIGQVGGATIATGAGAVGAGAQRMAVGQDSSTVAGSAPGVALDGNNAAFAGFIDMPTDGTTYAAGRSIEAECTVAGKVKFTATDASSRTVPVQIGLNIIPYAATKWTLTGVTAPATCTYANLK